MVNDIEKVETFKPTLGMEKWLDTAVDIASDSPTEISRESQLDKSNWYQWLKVDGFEDWYYAAYKSRRRRWLPTLDKIGMTQAKRGSYNHWKDMNAKAGDSTDAPQGNIQINNLIKIE